MAVVQTTVVTAFSRTPFIKPPDNQRGFTSMPRALVNLFAQAAVIEAKPINDQHDILVSLVLPREFAYRMVELSGRVVAAGADTWIPFAYIEITNGLRGLPLGATTFHTVALDQGMRKVPASGTLTMLQWGREDPRRPTYVIQARDGVAPTMTMKFKDQSVAATAAGTMDFLMTFLEYDIEQAQMYPVHWPILTYARD